MRLGFSVRLSIDGEAPPEQLWAVLEALGKNGSLASAARAVNCSYRHAWDLLRVAERQTGKPLAVLERGRGARLSGFGQKLLAVRARAHEDTRELLAHIAAEASRALAAANAQTLSHLHICASHDLALLEVKQHCARTTPRLDLELQFRGSLEALEQMARGRCDLAGFHVGVEVAEDPRLRRLLGQRNLRLITLADRRQGLMLAPGNPKRVRQLADLSRRGIRFVNRQPGSGTRLLFERLLAAAKCNPSAIHGYNDEEFTHVAVAATVASGHADAGFGIEAAAASYGLDFIPLSTESYYLAARRGSIEREPIQALLHHLSSRALRNRVAGLAGYDPGASGSLVDPEVALKTDVAAIVTNSADRSRVIARSRSRRVR